MTDRPPPPSQPPSRSPSPSQSQQPASADTPVQTTMLGRLRGAPATVALMVACVVVFLLAERTGRTTQVSTLLRWGASERSHIWRGEYWRFVTPMFLHIGWIHLVWNIYAIGGWCISIELGLGSRKFLTAYLLSGIFASAASVLGHDAVSAGASGAGFGIVGVALALLYYNLGSPRAFFGNKSVRSILFWIGVWLVLGFTVLPMDNFAHLGGFLYGALLGWVFTQSSTWEVSYRRMAWAMTFTLLAFTVAAARKQWPTQTAHIGVMEANLASEQAFERADYATALARLDDAHRYGDDTPELHQRRGLARALSGDFKGAVTDFEHALRVAPRDWSHRATVENQLDAARRATAPSPPSSASAK